NVSLNLGMQLAGKTVQVRFRIGTDEGSGAAGWDIDNIAFTGITNTPFPSIVDNATRACGDAGVPNPPDGGPAMPDANTTGGGGGAGGGGATGSGGNGPAGGSGGGSPTGGGGTSSGPSGAGGARSTTTGGGGGDDGGCSCSTPGAAHMSGFAHALAVLGALA